MNERGNQELLVDNDRGVVWKIILDNHLIPAERRLLTLLKRREGRPVSLDMLIAELEQDFTGCGAGNPRFHILNLRRKLGHSEERPVIKTCKGIGYYLVPGTLKITSDTSDT